MDKLNEWTNAWMYVWMSEPEIKRGLLIPCHILQYMRTINSNCTKIVCCWIGWIHILSGKLIQVLLLKLMWLQVFAGYDLTWHLTPQKTIGIMYSIRFIRTIHQEGNLSDFSPSVIPPYTPKPTKIRPCLYITRIVSTCACWSNLFPF